MISKDIVKKIKEELLLTDLTITDIAAKYNVSKATVNNINVGKSHRENTIYPIRQSSNNYFSDNEVAFIRKLSNAGYSAKQIHIILTKGSYSTISNILNKKTRAEELEYVSDNFLEERLRVFNFISTPHTELINQHSNEITFEDAIYIKFLGRFMADLLDTLVAFLPIIEEDMIGFNFPIEDREDLERYLEWGGTQFKTIWFIKNIFYNIINRIDEDLIYYNDFPIVRFKEVNPRINLLIVKEMVEFETKENYKKNHT
jgi:hypothetical protein